MKTPLKKLLSLLFIFSFYLIPITPSEASPIPNPPFEKSTSDSSQYVYYDGYKINVGTYRHFYQDPTDDFYASVNYVQLTFSDMTGKYNKLQKAIEAYSQKLFKESKSCFEELKEDLEESKKDFIENGLPRYNLTHDDVLQVMLADNNYLSFRTFEFVYTGGTHPHHGFFTKNFNVETGKVVALSDICTDFSALQKTLKDRLLADNPDVSFFDLDEYLFDETPKNNFKNLHFNIHQDGVCFYFNPYEVAPYAFSELAIFLSYKDYPSLFPSLSSLYLKN